MKHLRFYVSLVLGMTVLLLLLLVLVAASEDQEQITLVIGQQKVFSGKGITKISAGNEAIASVVTSKDQSQIIVKALRKGQTHFVMFRDDGTKKTVAVTVLAADPVKLKAELEEALKGIEGIKVRVIGEDKVVIDGEVYTEKDLRRCQKISEWYGDQVKLLVEFNDAYVPMKENLDVEFNLVEINKKSLGTIGVNWNDMLNIGVEASVGAPIPGGGFTGNVGITTNFGSALNVMVGDGSAKLLKKHNVVVQSGIQAKWFAGGTFYVRNITRETSSVVGIDYGTNIIVTPKIDRLRNMQLIVEAEISDLDSSNMIDGIPGLTKRNLQSQVTMKEGDTLLLAGVIDRVSGEDVQRIPGLGKIPILGWLFKSKSYQSGITDAVVFVTPKLIAADNEGSTNRIESIMDTYEKKE